MTAPSLYLHFRALGRPFLWAAYFRPSVQTEANECGSFAPVLCRLSLHRKCIRVLHLESVGRAAGAVGEVFALRYDAFEPELARVAKHERRPVHRCPR